MPLKHFTIGEIGEFTFDQVNQLVDAARWVERYGSQVEAMLRISKHSQVQRIFPALITDYTPLRVNNTVQPNRWLYAWTMAKWDWNTRKWVEATYSDGGSGGSTFGLTKHGSSEVIIGGGGSGQTFIVMNSTIDGDPFANGAVNGFENPNTAGDGVPGNDNGIISGVDIDSDSYPEGFSPQPINRGVKVDMLATLDFSHADPSDASRIQTWVSFSAPNAHDGECRRKP